MINANTITDEQIRELQEIGHVAAAHDPYNLLTVFCKIALGDMPGYRSKARSLCAEIINEQNARGTR